MLPTTQEPAADQDLPSTTYDAPSLLEYGGLEDLTQGNDGRSD